MKSIIIAIAVAVASVCAQAASVSWSSSAIKYNNAAIGKTTDAFTAVCTLYSDAAGTQVVGTSTSTTSTAMSVMSGTISDTATGATYYAKLVITAANGDTISSDLAELTTSAASTYSINFTNGNGFSTATAKINYASGWQGGSVPEPTTGLLVLLGIAGLALKRKVA